MIVLPFPSYSLYNYPMTQPQRNLPVPDKDWYRDILDGAPETINIVDRNGTMLYHNMQAEGQDPDSFVGRQIYDFFLPEYHEMVRTKIEQVFQTGEIGFYELASDSNQGDLRWYTTRLGPIIRDGQVVAVSLFIRNTTEIKQAEQALSRMNEDLEKRVVERTQALQEYSHRLEASETLNAVLRQAENRQEVFELLAAHSLSALEADLAGVYEVKEERLFCSFSYQHIVPPPPSLSPETDRFLYRMLPSSKIRYVPLNVPDTQGDTNCQFCCYMHSEQMQTLLVAPLRTGDTVVGVLYLGFRSARKKSAGDEQLLNGFVESGSNTLHRILVMDQLEQNNYQRERELSILYEIMAVASVEQDSVTLLKKSLNITLQAVNASIGVIHLAGPAGQKLNLAVREGFSDALHDWLLLSATAEDLWGKVYQQARRVQVYPLQTQSYHENTGPGVVVLAYLGVPIRHKDQTMGVLSIFGEDEALLEPGVIRLVSTLADQIGLALESTHQRKRDNEALILEERQRLARELHNSVSQSLYGLVLSADIGNKLLKLKAYPELAGTLQEIGAEALQSLKEMRLMLFELRPLSLEAVGLVGALELRLSTVEQRASIETSLDVSGMEYLPRQLELEVYRVSIEALNNSLKHSRASVVKVSLAVSPEQFELVITDNGQGFDRDQKRPGGIGLSSMKERSHRMGGKLTIDSNAAEGTRVCLVVPLNETQDEQERA